MYLSCKTYPRLVQSFFRLATEKAKQKLIQHIRYLAELSGIICLVSHFKYEVLLCCASSSKMRSFENSLVAVVVTALRTRLCKHGLFSSIITQNADTKLRRAGIQRDINWR